MLVISAVIASGALSSGVASAQFGRPGDRGGDRGGGRGPGGGGDRGGRGDSYNANVVARIGEDTINRARELQRDIDRNGPREARYDAESMELAGQGLLDQGNARVETCKIRKKAKDAIKIYKSLRDKFRDARVQEYDSLQRLHDLTESLRREFDLDPWDNYCDR